MSDELNNLDKLEKTLYRRDQKPEPLKRTKLNRNSSKVNSGWKNSKDYSNVSNNVNSQTGTSFLTKLLIVAFLFFIVSVGLAFYILNRGDSLISNQRIDFQMRGPVAVNAGDITSIQITISNRNQVELQDVALVLNFPSGTRSASSTDENLNRERLKLETIDPGETINRTIKAIYLGNEDETKVVRGQMEYKVPGSNALYTKTTDISFEISSPPVVLDIRYPEQVVEGQEANLRFTIIPQSKDIEKDVLLQVEYPVGFNFDRASIEPSFQNSNSAWLFENPEQGKEKEVIVYGTFSGESREEKNFRVRVGTPDDILESEVDLVYNEQVITIILSNPFVDVSTSINQNRTEGLVIERDRVYPVSVNFTNNLEQEVTDGSLSVELEGQFDESNLLVENGGFYNSETNTVSWNKSTVSKLQSLLPGESGRVSFRVKTLPLSNDSSVINPIISMTTNFSGVKASEDFSGEEVQVVEESESKIQTMTDLEVETYHYSGSLTNSGPMPPRAEEETTYEIVWRVSNTTSEIKDTIVKTNLPQYVEWKNNFLPNNESIRFNSSSRELVWQIGRMSPHSTEEIAFQIGFTPSLSQVGDAPDLTSDIRLSTFDTFTEKVIEDEEIPSTIRLEDDPQFRRDEGEVIE